MSNRRSETRAGSLPRPGLLVVSLYRIVDTVLAFLSFGTHRAQREGTTVLEPTEVARWERNLQAMLFKAGSEDPEGFATVAGLIERTYLSLAFAAGLMREQHGYSWREIATAMGEPTSSVHKRMCLPSHLAADRETLVTLIRTGVKAT